MCSLDVVVDDRLRERVNWAAGQDGEQFLRDWSRSSSQRDWVPAQGRSSRQAGREALSAVIEHAVQGRVVVLVPHGGVTADLLRDLLGDEALDDVAPGLVGGGVPGAAIPELQQGEAGWWPTRIAQVDHLDASQRSRHQAL